MCYVFIPHTHAHTHTHTHTHTLTHTHTHTHSLSLSLSSISSVSTLTIQGRVYPVKDHYLPEICRAIGWRETGDEYTPDTNVDLVCNVVVYLARSQPMVRPLHHHHRHLSVVMEMLIFVWAP